MAGYLLIMVDIISETREIMLILKGNFGFSF